MKKLFSIVATLAILSTSVANIPASASFSSELEGAYDYAYGIGITTQSSIDNANMYGNLIRSHMAKMMSEYATKVLELTPDTSKTCEFNDIANETAELQGFIKQACQLGLMGVGITSFRPNDAVTRAEFGTVLSRAIWGETNNGGNPYYVNHLNALKDAKVMTDISNPEMKEVRGYVMLMMQRADEDGAAQPAICSTPENVLACALDLDTCPAQCTGEAEVEANPGFAAVSKVGTVSTQDVPKNAQGVKVGTIKLTAGENDTTVSSVVITRSGLGNVSDVSSVWLSRPGLVTDPRTFSTSSQTATVRFAPSLVLKAGSSMEFDVLVSLAGAENNNHNFAVTAVNVVNGTASGTPVELGSVRTTSYSVSTVAVSITNGSIVNGKTNQTFATIDLTPTKESVVNGFTISKGAGEDYTKVMNNVKAYHNNVEVGTVSVSTDKIIVTNLNISRLAGELARIELKGDAIYVGPALAAGITFRINESADVSVNEKASGYNSPVSTVLPVAPAAMALGAVDLTITKKTTGTKTVAPGTSSVELLNVEVKSDAEFDVSNYNIVLTNGTNLLNFVDSKVTVYVNGVDTEWKNTDGTTKTFAANADRFTVEPNKPVIIRVVGNVLSNAATVPNDYIMTLNITQVKNISNGNTSVIAKSQAGDKVTVKNGTAIIKAATVAPASASKVYANADLEIGRFALRAEAEKVIARKITVANIGTLVDLTTVISSNNVKLVDAATDAQISASVTVNAGNIVFDNVSIDVEKDTDRNFKIVANTQGFDNTNHGRTIIMDTVTLNTVDKASGGAAAGTYANISATAKTYTVGIQPPVVTLTKKDASTFIVTVKNVDSESDLTLNSVTARVRPVADNNSSYVGKFFLRANGSSITDSTALGANISATVGNVPGVSSALVLTAPQLISKNGSSYTYEIYVDSNFVNPPTLLGEVTAVAYNTTSETYALSAQ